MTRACSSAIAKATIVIAIATETPGSTDLAVEELSARLNCRIRCIRPFQREQMNHRSMVAPTMENNEMKRVVVTGSNGMIGRMVLDAWRESGAYDVVGLARSESEYTDVLADTNDMDALVKAFTGADA